jgi:hypothetical protein
MSARIDISEYLREHGDYGEILLRGKWAMDGAESLDEAAHMLRAFADELEALASAGFHLMGPIEDDHGFAHRGDEVELVERAAEQRSRGPHHLNEDEGRVVS